MTRDAPFDDGKQAQRADGAQRIGRDGLAIDGLRKRPLKKRLCFVPKGRREIVAHAVQLVLRKDGGALSAEPYGAERLYYRLQRQHLALEQRDSLLKAGAALHRRVNALHCFVRELRYVVLGKLAKKSGERRSRYHLHIRGKLPWGGCAACKTKDP